MWPHTTPKDHDFDKFEFKLYKDSFTNKITAIIGKLFFKRRF